MKNFRDEFDNIEIYDDILESNTTEADLTASVKSIKYYPAKGNISMSLSAVSSTRACHIERF
jgi:hypothetical protein